MGKNSFDKKKKSKKGIDLYTPLHIIQIFPNFSDLRHRKIKDLIITY